MSVKEYFMCFIDIPSDVNIFWNNIRKIISGKKYSIIWDFGIERQMHEYDALQYQGIKSDNELFKWFLSHSKSSSFNLIISDRLNKDFVMGMSICPEGQGCSICPINSAYISITFHLYNASSRIYYESMLRLIKTIIQHISPFYGLSYRNEIPDDYITNYILKRNAHMPFEIMYYGPDFHLPIDKKHCNELKELGFKFEKIKNGTLIYHSNYRYWTSKDNRYAFSKLLSFLGPSEDEKHYWYYDAKK